LQAFSRFLLENTPEVIQFRKLLTNVLNAQLSTGGSIPDMEIIID
jgi:hypothetical protein